MAELLEIKGMPTVIIIDEKGFIQNRMDGYSYSEMNHLEDFIKSK